MDVQTDPHYTRQRVEYESTIEICVEREAYAECLRRFSAGTEGITSYRVDVILVFENGTRLHERRVECKETLDLKRVLSMYDNTFFPIKRTKSMETLVPIVNADLSLLSHSTYRMLRVVPSNGVRLSVNKHTSNDGERYSIEAEIEYSTNSSYNEIIQTYERCLMEVMYPFKDLFQTNELRLKDLFSSIAPKIQMWNTFDKRQPYRWAYKWNGIKAKMLCANKRKIYLWPDAKQINVVSFESDDEDGLEKLYKLIKHVCIQVELMHDRMIIVEIIAVSFYNQIYSCEPHTSLRMLAELSRIIDKYQIRVSLATTAPLSSATAEPSLITSVSETHTQQSLTSCNDITPKYQAYKLQVQQFYESSLPATFDQRYYDGFIIVQNNMNIKWKYPTVDVKYVGKDGDRDVFQLEDVQVPVRMNNEKTPLRLEPRAIYEIAPNMTILRKRNDRITSSTKAEYDVFIKSINVLLRK